MMMYSRGLGLGYGMGGGWFGAILMALFGLLVIAGIVLLVMWAVRTSHLAHSGTSVGSRRAPLDGDEAVAVCRRRYASGEIDKAQYDEMMDALGR